MSELANYSIETDQLVWLAFKDGQSLRVPIGQLPRYLTPRDLQRVRRAMKLRRDFFRHHMPPTVIVALVLGLAVAALAGQQAVAFVWSRTHPVPAPAPQTEIVRNLTPTNAEPLPAPSPLVSPPTGQVAVAPTRRSATAKLELIRTRAPIAAKLKPPVMAVAPLVDPVITPLPSLSPTPSPAPSPLPSPEPTPPPGQVLGDSAVAGLAPVAPAPAK